MVFPEFIFNIQKSLKSSDQSSELLDKYDVDFESKPLGQGTFAIVYRAALRKEDRKAAVKQIDISKFANFRRRVGSVNVGLEKEINILRKLDHPNLLQLLDVFWGKDYCYIVTERMKGGDLLNRILDDGIFLEKRTQELFAGLCRGVCYLHDRGMIHRDIKPENCLLNGPATIMKLADFGLTRLIEVNSEGGNLKQCVTVCGTPHYFAPELVKAEMLKKNQSPEVGYYSAKVDVWALGCVLYIMLSGCPPFDDDDLFDLILEGQFEMNLPQFQDKSEASLNLVRQMMKVDPEKRVSIQQVLAHPWVENCGDSGPSTSTTPSPSHRGLGHEMKSCTEELRQRHPSDSGKRPLYDCGKNEENLPAFEKQQKRACLETKKDEPL